jgi:hypothetical protein
MLFFIMEQIGGGPLPLNSRPHPQKRMKFAVPGLSIP